MKPSLRLGVAAVILVLAATTASAQRPTIAARSPSAPSEDVEQVTNEARRTPPSPILNIDRPIYQALQANKKWLSENYGINWALEDTLIYQATSGGVDPNDAMVNTLGLFATWKIFRDPN